MLSNWRPDQQETEVTLSNGDTATSSSGAVRYLFDKVESSSQATWRVEHQVATSTYTFVGRQRWVDQVWLVREPEAPAGRVDISFRSPTNSQWQRVKHPTKSGFKPNKLAAKLKVWFDPVYCSQLRISVYAQSAAQGVGLREWEIRSPADQVGGRCSNAELSLACWHMAQYRTSVNSELAQQIRSIRNLCGAFESIEQHLYSSGGAGHTAEQFYQHLEAIAPPNITRDIPSFISRVCNWPPQTCDYCRFKQIPRFSGMSESGFIDLILQGRPFIVQMPPQSRAKIHGSKALDFVRELYVKYGAASLAAYKDKKVTQEDYKDVFEFFRQINSSSTGKVTAQQTYFGWPEIRPNVVREMDAKLVMRPGFIPPTLWAGHLKQQRWVFLGKPGPGIEPHIDHVPDHGTWQYQLAGSKQWLLKPRSECATSCPDHVITVSPGEVFVLDTTQWMHSTECLPDVCLPNFTYAPKQEFVAFQVGSSGGSCATVGGDFYAPVCPGMIPQLNQGQQAHHKT